MHFVFAIFRFIHTVFTIKKICSYVRFESLHLNLQICTYKSSEIGAYQILFVFIVVVIMALIVIEDCTCKSRSTWILVASFAKQYHVLISCKLYWFALLPC